MKILQHGDSKMVACTHCGCVFQVCKAECDVSVRWNETGKLETWEIMCHECGRMCRLEVRYDPIINYAVSVDDDTPMVFSGWRQGELHFTAVGEDMRLFATKEQADAMCSIIKVLTGKKAETFELWGGRKSMTDKDEWRMRVLCPGEGKKLKKLAEESEKAGGVTKAALDYIKYLETERTMLRKELKIGRNGLCDICKHGNGPFPEGSYCYYGESETDSCIECKFADCPCHNCDATCFEDGFEWIENVEWLMEVQKA